jgi:hypothetical protein
MGIISAFFWFGLKENGHCKGEQEVSPLRRHNAPPSVEMTVWVWVERELGSGFEGGEVAAVAQHEGEELAGGPVAGDVAPGL